MDRSASLVRKSCISTYSPSMQLLYPLPLPRSMRHCLGVIGRIDCPCGGYVLGPKKDSCDACSHSFGIHIQSPAAPSSSSSSTMGPTPGPLSMPLTTLFNHLLKSSRSGTAALQETSNGLRKQQGVSTLTKRLEMNGILTIGTESLAFKAACNAKYNRGEGEQPFPFPFCCLPYVWP